jgi:hypothetical protein
MPLPTVLEVLYQNPIVLPIDNSPKSAHVLICPCDQFVKPGLMVIPIRPELTEQIQKTFQWASPLHEIPEAPESGFFFFPYPLVTVLVTALEQAFSVPVACTGPTRTYITP